MTSRKVFANILFHARDFIKPFALFCIVKNTFQKNTIIYNYNYHKVAKIAGIHHKTAERYISRLLKEGYCEIQGNNLLFKSQYRIAKELNLGRTKSYHLDCNLTIKEVTDNLFLMMVKIHAARQEYRNDTGQSDNVFGAERLARFDKFKWDPVIKRQFSETIGNGLHFSTRSIGRLTLKSHSTALRYLKRLRKNKYLTYENLLNKVKKIDIEDYYSIIDELNRSQPGFWFYKDGWLFQHQGLEISFM